MIIDTSNEGRHIDMAFVTLKPGTLLAPVPAAMISCAAEDCAPNIITLAWVGTVCSEPPMCSISVRKERYSYDIIRRSGEFVINLCGKKQMPAVDLCGVKSGRDTDKFKLCGLQPVKAEGMEFAPAISGAPVYLACKVKDVKELGSHDLFLGEIVGLGVDESLLDESGRIDYDRAELIAYNHGSYYELGKLLGFFGYSVAAPDVLERRMKQLSGK